MNFLDRALPLIARNFSIIPLGANSKAPQKGIGAKQRSTGKKDFQQIESWAQRFPDANVGLVADERFCILESDDYARLAELIRNGTGEEIPETMRSGRDPNRPHLIFRHSNKSRTIGCPALPGIFECRFTNQYVVGPGSEVDGTAYKIFVDVPPVEIPDWLVTELVRLAQVEKKERSNPTVKTGPNGKVTEGGRHYKLMEEIGRRWDGEISEEDFIAWAVERNDELCDPPKPIAHVVQCVRDIMKKAPHNPGPKVMLGNSDKSGNVDPEHWTLTSLSTIEAKPIRWLWTNNIAIGKLNTYSGEPGHGKSLISIDLAARCSVGKEFPDGAPNAIGACDTLICTLEEDVADTIKPRLLAAGGDPKRVHFISQSGRALRFSIVQNEAKLRSLFSRHPDIKLAVFDPLLDFTRSNQNADTEVRQELTLLADIANEFGFAAIGINHLNKKTDLKAMHRVAGARGWTAVARMNYLVFKGEEKTPEGTFIRHVCPLKINLAADDRPSLDFVIAKGGVLTEALIIGQVYPILHWLGPGTATADDMGAAAVRTTEADTWLKKFLEHGNWVPSEEVKDAGAKQKFSVDQIKRAKQRCNVEDRRIGMPARTEWRWRAVEGDTVVSVAGLLQ